MNTNDMTTNDMKTDELTLAQKDFLGARGFQVLYGSPTRETKYSYFVLREPQKFIETSEIAFHKDSHYFEGTAGIAHPSNQPLDVLVSIIEQMAAGKTWLGELMPDLEKMLPAGQAIQMHIVDRAWDPIVSALKDKYPR